ncbi:MAG: hypothetical protein ACREDL_19425, partial [Bradyrhizobium sp.]
MMNIYQLARVCAAIQRPRDGDPNRLSPTALAKNRPSYVPILLPKQASGQEQLKARHAKLYPPDKMLFDKILFNDSRSANAVQP